MNIDYPLHIGARGRSAATTDDDHVRDMIEQLLFTQPGERVNRPDFGSGLMHLVFGPNSSAMAATLQFTMQASLQRWLGDVIEVRRLDVDAVDALLAVTLDYRIRRSGEERSDTFTTDLRHE
jgi:phage baseplate assembly protein W